jgi:hypothetical protein
VKAKLLNDYVADGQNAWLLPNLAFAGEAWAVVRLRVPSPASAVEGQGEGLLSLCSFSVRYTTLDGEPRAIQPYPLALPALPASAFHAIAEDELVARRAGELEAAYLQTKARAAARNGDWAGVESALRKAERAAANNPWVAESVKELRALAAQKDEVMFSKESAFAARRMSTRLAASHESLCCAQREIRFDDGIGHVDLAARGLLDQPDSDQHAHILVYALDVPLERPCEAPHARRSQRLQPLDQLPALGTEHAKQRGGRLEREHTGGRRSPALPSRGESPPHLLEHRGRVSFHAQYCLVHDPRSSSTYVT